MTGPLAGTKIIDLSAIIAGPMATQILADQGAQVIKVEPLGLGDLARYLGPMSGGISAMFAVTNRGKRSIALNLKDEKGKAILLDLVRTADVFVENFRPGVIERLGLGYDVLAGINPKITYVNMSGFGETGPYAAQRVYDPVIQAVSGFADSQSDPKTNEPRIIQSIVCDKVTALTAAQAITAALLAAAKGAGGQLITLNMLDATLAFLWPDVFYNHTFLTPGIGTAPEFAKFYQVNPTNDGYLTLITISDEEFRSLATALGQEALLKDPRFATVADRLKNVEILDAEVAGILARLSTAEAVQRLRANDVPNARVNRREDVPLDPQVRHNGALEESTHPAAGPMRQARPAAQFTATPSRVGSPAPALGEHTDAILGELGRDAAAIKALRAAKIVG
ncbi:MAG: CoA transferase [Alphaproteobacteria bacterium]|nr:CoA transferase [Alphaproteobacteria bacterium]